eukprot:1161810-Pelagomonas_calceolata.AAC.16
MKYWGKGISQRRKGFNKKTRTRLEIARVGVTEVFGLRQQGYGEIVRSQCKAARIMEDSKGPVRGRQQITTGQGTWQKFAGKEWIGGKREAHRGTGAHRS